jgi:hypothetical protein
MGAGITTANPHVERIRADMRSRDKWLQDDEKILKKRLSERKAKRNKPYPGAPNFVVPIIDDSVRDKTDMEITMMANARRMAHIIPLQAGIDGEARARAELGFDVFLRHIIKAVPKTEEGLDMKNARGFAIFKVLRTQDPRWGLVPDFEARDCRNIIVPPATKEIQKAERITDDSCYYSERELKALAKDRPLMKAAVVDEVVRAHQDRDARNGNENRDMLKVTEGLIGVDVSGNASKEIAVWEHYTYADEFIADQDEAGSVVVGDKVRILFSPTLTEKLLEVEAWREEDQVEVLPEAELMQEMASALMEGREPVTTRVLRGKERPWPFIQARYENRSRYFYDTRGLGKLLMDDQLQATSEKNAKMVLLDYFQVPMYQGSGNRAGTNITHEPGSFLPDNVQAVQPPQIPQQFDFDVEQAKRTAARRSGTLGQYEFSANLSATKRVQKTATEVSEESARGGMISSASVDRFNNPWTELYMQLWEDLKRLKIVLPLINDQMEYAGDTGLEMYDWNVLIVPASSAKTLNPDQQFQRDSSAWAFATANLAPMGVVLDPQAAAMDILAAWDPYKASRWVKKPNEGQAGQQPVYVQLQQLGQEVQALIEAVKAIGASHLAGGETSGVASGEAMPDSPPRGGSGGMPR